MCSEKTIFMDLLNSVIMENLIEGRVILGLLCLVHLFVNYAAGVGARHEPLSKKVLNGVILTELVVVTVYVICDNLQTPPHNGWLLAIVGYFFVYGLIFVTWILHCIYALLDQNKVYAMTPQQFVPLYGGSYMKGTVEEDNHKIDVFLPHAEFANLEKTHPKILPVKFKQVLRGRSIIVTLS